MQIFLAAIFPYLPGHCSNTKRKPRFEVKRDLNAIILAGGEGTRLKSVTGDLPKPMVQLCGRPVLEHILALLKRNGVPCFVFISLLHL